jgi:hypothetical protein
MEIIDIGGKEGTCSKCHVGLSAEEKRSGMSICVKCMTELADMVTNSIGTDDIEEYSNNVSDFTDFVSSSARLMGLDDIVIIQVCFNIYMDGVRDVADRDPNMARKIFKDARRFIDIELERLEDSGEDDSNKSDDGRKEFFEQMMGNINKMMKDHHKANCRTDGVSGEKDNINNKKVDGATDKFNTADKFNTKNETRKDNRNEDTDDNKKGSSEENKQGGAEDNAKGSKSGSRRIRVD